MELRGQPRNPHNAWADTLPFILAKLSSLCPSCSSAGGSSVAGALERLSLLGLVASTLVEFTTGILDIDYHFPGSVINFYAVHYYGAWVFAVLFVLHACVKLPTVRRAYRERGVLKPLLQRLPETIPEPPVADGLAPANPPRPLSAVVDYSRCWAVRH